MAPRVRKTPKGKQRARKQRGRGMMACRDIDPGHSGTLPSWPSFSATPYIREATSARFQPTETLSSLSVLLFPFHPQRFHYFFAPFFPHPYRASFRSHRLCLMALSFVISLSVALCFRGKPEMAFKIAVVKHETDW